jgi:hypothetical protein
MAFRALVGFGIPAATVSTYATYPSDPGRATKPHRVSMLTESFTVEAKQATTVCGACFCMQWSAGVLLRLSLVWGIH